MGIFGGKEEEAAIEQAFGFEEVPAGGGGGSGFEEMPPPPPPPPPQQGQQMAAAPPPPMQGAQQRPAQAPMPMPGRDMTLEGTAPMVRSQSGLERLDSVEQSLTDFVRRVDLLDKSTEDIRSDIARVRDSIASMEGDMRELTSLYDLISTQINPFIEAEMAQRQSITAMEEEGQAAIPELDALFEPTPEIAAEGKVEAVPAEDEAIPAPFEVVGEEGWPVAAVAAAVKRIARLSKVGDSPTCQMAFVHWINFLLDSVPRREVPNLLAFYIKVGWISTGIKQEVIDFVRGVSGEELEEDEKAKKAKAKAAGKPKDKDGDVVMTYDKEELHELARTEVKKGGKEGARYDSWKMSAEDHLKSLILIERIRGAELDKDALEALERDVAMLKEGLDDFFAL